MKESKLKLQPTTVALVTKKSRAVVSPRNERKTTTLPGEAKEDNLSTTSRTEDKQKVRGTNKVQASCVKSLANVSFPCGFTPSQCALLASRQRISNYICFKTNDDREEILPTKNNRNKEKARDFGLKTYNSVQKRDLYSTTRHQSNAQGVNSPHRLPPMQEYETSINEKTGLTGSFKWKSKEEIAKYLAAHAHARLLWLQELEMMNVLTSARGNNLSDKGTPENFRSPPQKPVYLFDKNLAR